MSNILVLQHVAREPLGTLNPLLKTHGFRIRYVNFDRHPDAKPSLEGYDGLIILGGPMNVDQTDLFPHLAYEVELVGMAIERKLPVLGVCLGAQLIAKALGATVTQNKEKEIGWHDLFLTDEGKKDPIFSHFGPCEKMFQWHEDAFALPQKAVHLAFSPLCNNQAFRYGDKVYGFQFHMEVDEALIRRWLKHEGTALKPEKILEETHQHIGRLKELGERGFGRFVDLLGIPRKRAFLPSR